MFSRALGRLRQLRLINRAAHRGGFFVCCRPRPAVRCVCGAQQLQRQGVGEGLGDRLDREGVIDVADPDPVTVDGLGDDREPVGVGVGQFGDVIGRRAAAQIGHVGGVLQAYLHRTIDDINDLLPLKPNIRLCKGIYLEPREIAYTDRTITDQAALALWNQAPRLASDYLTDFSTVQSEKTMKRWLKLRDFLLWKYLDGNLKDEHGKVHHPGYSEDFYRAIIESTGDHFKAE